MGKNVRDTHAVTRQEYYEIIRSPQTSPVTTGQNAPLGKNYEEPHAHLRTASTMLLGSIFEILEREYFHCKDIPTRSD